LQLGWRLFDNRDWRLRLLYDDLLDLLLARVEQVAEIPSPRSEFTEFWICFAFSIIVVAEV
jgi:hypothetical protein